MEGKMNRIIGFMATIIVGLMSTAVLADVVVLTDGSIISGEVTLNQDQITVTNAMGAINIDREQVSGIRSTGSAPPPASTVSYPSVPAAYYNSGYAYGGVYPDGNNVAVPTSVPNYPSVAPAYYNSGYAYGGVYPNGSVPASSVTPEGFIPLGAAPMAAPVYFPAPVTPQQVTTPYDQLLQVVVETANVRRGPGTQYEIASRINRDDLLYRVGHTQEWFNVVTRSGQSGWIHQDNVAAMGQGPDLSPYRWDFVVEVPDRIVTAQVLNVRSGPGTSHTVVDQLFHNDTVKTIAQSGDWYRVKYLEPPSHTGWVHGSYITDIYHHVRGLVIHARYDDVVAIGVPALPALTELLNHQDWKVRYGASMVRSKIVANQNMLSGVHSYNYEIFHHQQ